MTAAWVVVRHLPTGSFHVVSAVSFPTRDDAVWHLHFVRASVRKGLRGEYGLARVEPIAHDEGDG